MRAAREALVDLDARVSHATLFDVRCVNAVDRRGADVALAIAKLTLTAGARGDLLFRPASRAIRLLDELTHGERGASVRLPNDAVPEKPGTDVLLVGTAHPPERGLRAMDVSLRVGLRHGTLDKTVRVHGRRVWTRALTGIAPSRALSLEPTPLVYERAYGGRDESDPTRPLVDARNPAGCGIARSRTNLIGADVPQLEDPRAPLESGSPAPAAFAPIAGDWSPRAERAGTFDARWRRTRAPLWPVDMDPQFFCTAPADQWSKEPLKGGETVLTLGVRPEGPWRFALPDYRPVFRFVARGRIHDAPTHLDTVLIDADAREVELVWRATMSLPRKQEHFEQLDVCAEGSVALPGMRRP